MEGIPSPHVRVSVGNLLSDGMRSILLWHLFKTNKNKTKTISLIGLIRKYLAITFDLKILWFIKRVHWTNLTLD